MKETVLLLLNQQIAVNKAKTKIFSKDNADRAFAACLLYTSDAADD